MYKSRLLIPMILALAMLTGCASTGSNAGRVERITPEELAKILPAPVATIPLSEIVTDSKQGKKADEIIAKIKASNSRYALTPSQVLNLNQQGIDIKVLDYIQQSNELAQQNAIAEELNKREKEKRATQKLLNQQRDLNRNYNNRYYDPFFGGFYGRPYYGYGSRFGHRFGFGLGYGYPFGW